MIFVDRPIEVGSLIYREWRKSMQVCNTHLWRPPTQKVTGPCLCGRTDVLQGTAEITLAGQFPLALRVPKGACRVYVLYASLLGHNLYGDRSRGTTFQFRLVQERATS
jgi:hypothetical protein